MATVTKQITLKGRVQGVGFRYATCEEAARRGLAGYVKNLPDGSVEAVFQGPEADVRALLEWAKQGPVGARVDASEESDGAGTYRDFEIRY